MAVTGKTGADAIFFFLGHICRVINRYRNKLIAVVAAAEANDVITTEQAVLINDFIGTVATVCAAFQLVAGYSGF